MSILNFASSAIMSFGIKADAKEIFDMNGVDFNKIPDKIRGASFKALISKGWTEEGIKAAIREANTIKDESSVELIYNICKSQSETVTLETSR